jgi:hypothetical protein
MLSDQAAAAIPDPGANFSNAGTDTPVGPTGRKAPRAATAAGPNDGPGRDVDDDPIEVARNRYNREHRLARSDVAGVHKIASEYPGAVAAQLGLTCIGIEYPEFESIDATTIRPDEKAVGSYAEIRVADRADPVGRDRSPIPARSVPVRVEHQVGVSQRLILNQRDLTHGMIPSPLCRRSRPLHSVMLGSR